MLLTRYTNSYSGFLDPFVLYNQQSSTLDFMLDIKFL